MDLRVLCVLALIASPSLLQTTTTPTPSHKRLRGAAPSYPAAALHSLVGRPIYLCRFDPLGHGPGFFDGAEASGAPIRNEIIANYFSEGERLTIREADTDMQTIDDPLQKAHPSTWITLKVQGDDRQISAFVNVAIRKADMTPTKLFAGVADTMMFSRLPLEQLGIEIGSREKDVLCAYGYPQHWNHDELGGDQLVYRSSIGSGTTYVYIDRHTKRVRNFQTSD